MRDAFLFGLLVIVPYMLLIFLFNANRKKPEDTSDDEDNRPL